MEDWLKRALAIIAIFIAIVPIGILGTWNYSEAWGEWGMVSELHWTPKSYWNAPLPDYNMHGWETMFQASLGYWISAVTGIAILLLVTYGIGKVLVKVRGKEISA